MTWLKSVCKLAVRISHIWQRCKRPQKRPQKVSAPGEERRLPHKKMSSISKMSASVPRHSASATVLRGDRMSTTVEKIIGPQCQRYNRRPPVSASQKISVLQCQCYNICLSTERCRPRSVRIVSVRQCQ